MIPSQPKRKQIGFAIALAPGPLAVPDENLQLHTAAELKAELEQGTERTWGDINPLKVMRQRK